MLLAATILLVTPAPGALAAQPQDAGDRPNIVVFLVDDLGWQDASLAFWTERTPFNDRYRTPNLERLASQGILFTRAYAAPVCSPTRTSIMTGQNPSRHQVTQWTLYPDQDRSGVTQRLRSAPWRMEGLQPGDLTLPRVLREAGYYTIHVGKAHWGAHGTPGEDPRRLGFDVNIAGHCAGAPGSYQGVSGFGARKGNIWAVPGLDQYRGLDVHLTEALTIEALRALDEPVSRGQPFYLYLAHYAVHAPIQPHDPYTRAYREAGVDEIESKYAGMVEGVDVSLGAVLRWLDRRGIAGRTIVLYTSDNGGLSAHARGQTPMGTGANTHNWPLKAGKGSAYEGGIRVPWVVAWAQRDPREPLQQGIPVAAAARSDVPVIVEDIFPTVLRWAGASAPVDHVVDGRDITPLLAGGRTDWTERPLVDHYPHVWGPRGPGYEPHSSVILGSWKAIYFYQPRRWELYDLAADIGEEHDLAAEQPERLRELAGLLLQTLRERGAHYPRNRETGEEEPPFVPEH